MPNFLFTVISSDNFFKYSNDNAKGTKMPRGDKHYILKYGIPIPPLSEQRRIASTLMKVDALISNLDKGKDLTIAFREARLHLMEAVTQKRYKRRGELPDIVVKKKYDKPQYHDAFILIDGH